MPIPDNISPEDSKTGWTVVTILAMMAVVAIAAILATGWGPGSLMFIDACSPKAIQLGANIMSLGFGMCALLLGLRNTSNIPVTMALFWLTLLTTDTVFFTNWLVARSSSFSHNGQHMNYPEAMLFLIPSAAGFAFGTAIRMYRARRTGAGKPWN